MIWVGIALVVILFWIGTVLRTLNNNFARWANHNLRRRP